MDVFPIACPDVPVGDAFAETFWERCTSFPTDDSFFVWTDACADKFTSERVKGGVLLFEEEFANAGPDATVADIFEDRASKYVLFHTDAFTSDGPDAPVE